MASQVLQCGLAGRLLALLLGVAAPLAALYSLYFRLVDEHRAVAVVALLLYQFEVKLHLVLLAPLYEFALEVYLLVGHLVEVD